MIKLLFRICLFSLLCTPFFISYASAHTSGGIAVENAWVREAPPNTKVLAAYLKIQNHTAKKRSISAVTSTQFEKIEIHLSTNIDGVVKMKAIGMWISLQRVKSYLHQVDCI